MLAGRRDDAAHRERQIVAGQGVDAVEEIQVGVIDAPGHQRGIIKPSSDERLSRISLEPWPYDVYQLLMCVAEDRVPDCQPCALIRRVRAKRRVERDIEISPELPENFLVLPCHHGFLGRGRVTTGTKKRLRAPRADEIGE